MIELHMYAVRRIDPDGNMNVISAWTDEYDARFEVARWEQDLKLAHDYIGATLVLREDGEV